MVSKVYDIITDIVIKAIEQNKCLPWKACWKTFKNRNLASGHVYSGVNAIITAMSGFNSPYWLTRNQIKEKGGSWSGHYTPIVSWGTHTKIVKGKDGKDKNEEIPYIKFYQVWNLDQCTGIKVPVEEVKTFNKIERAEQIVAGYKDRPEIVNENTMPYYSPSTDKVGIPAMKNFDKEEYYYSTLFHELIHSTGAEKRLNRIKTTAYGSGEYSKEELVAEIGAMFLNNEAGIDDVPKEENLAYINGWIAELRRDTTMIVQASSKAQKASNYILGIQTAKMKEVIEGCEN